MSHEASRRLSLLSADPMRLGLALVKEGGALVEPGLTSKFVSEIV